MGITSNTYPFEGKSSSSPDRRSALTAAPPLRVVRRQVNTTNSVNLVAFAQTATHIDLTRHGNAPSKPLELQRAASRHAKTSFI